MNPLGTVLVGVDGSAASARALRWAAGQVASGTEVHVVHAFSPALELTLAAMQQDWNPIRDRSLDDLAGDWTDPAREVGASVQTHFIDDDPADGIIAMIETAEADTIVIGPHGNGHGPAFGLGSVTRRLLHASPVPVVIIGDADDSESTASAEAPFVLACVGYGPASTNAAEWAAQYALERGLPLVILHVVSYRPIFPFAPPTDMLAYYLGGDVSEAWAQDDLDVIRERIGAAHPDLQITTEVGHGSAAKGIAKISAGAELVVIGRLQHAGLASCVISTRTKAIITGVSAPVAVIPSCPTQT